MSYKYFNANNKNNFVNDCTIRAISLAEGKTWQETYDELSYIAGKNGIILDDVNFIEPLLDYRYRRIQTKDRTVGEFANHHPRGTYLITMKGHITCCIGGPQGGTIYDTFDCTDREIWSVWEVK